MDLSAVRDFAEAQGWSVAEARWAALQAFGEELYRRNETTNLTRVAIEDCAIRHFVDSLLVAEFCAEGAKVLDLGSGPGFPSWPLACLRPDLKVTMLDSSGKMLRLPNDMPLPNLEVVQSRAEDWNRREAFDVVTGRAVAPLAIHAEIGLPWAAVSGRFVPFRTPNDFDEIRRLPSRKLGALLESIEERDLPGTEVVRVFPIWRKFEPTDRRFPRSWKEIRQSPLGS